MEPLRKLIDAAKALLSKIAEYYPLRDGTELPPPFDDEGATLTACIPAAESLYAALTAPAEGDDAIIVEALSEMLYYALHHGKYRHIASEEGLEAVVLRFKARAARDAERWLKVRSVASCLEGFAEDPITHRRFPWALDAAERLKAVSGE